MKNIKSNTLFCNWFSDSVVQDSEGNPLVVYHGTCVEFDAFDLDKKGSNTGWQNTLHGFFFLKDKTLAQNFAEENNSGGSVILKEVYLSIKKPMDITLQSFFNNGKQAVDIVDFLTGGEQKLTESESLEWINENIDIPDWLELSDALNTPEFNQFLIDKKYDGIMSNFGDNNIEYVAFYPHQIKSAVGNIGAFDPLNPSILM